MQEGIPTVSANGLLVSFPCYTAVPNQFFNRFTYKTLVTVRLDGLIDASTSVSIYSQGGGAVTLASRVSQAVTADGTQFYTSGAGYGSFYAAKGASSAARLVSTSGYPGMYCMYCNK